jgi:hypothetical protein
MLCRMVVEIESQERNDIRNRLYLVLRMTNNIGFIEVELT